MEKFRSLIKMDMINNITFELQYPSRTGFLCVLQQDDGPSVRDVFICGDFRGCPARFVHRTLRRAGRLFVSYKCVGRRNGCVTRCYSVYTVHKQNNPTLMASKGFWWFRLIEIVSCH